MANQDQQNCTDNATIEKDDEIYKLPLSDSSSTSSNLSMQQFNEAALNEILEPVVALDDEFDGPFVTSCPPPSFYRTTHDEKQEDCLPPSFYRTPLEEKQNLSMQQFNETALNEILEPVVALDDEFDGPFVTSCPPPSFYRTTHDEKQEDCPPPLFFSTSHDKKEAVQEDCPLPSFYRTIHEKQGITGDEQLVMPRENYFIVRPMVSTDNNVPHEDDWEIREELAVCNFCFNKLIVQEIMMKTKCRCKDALVHEACALNKKCHSCGINFDKIKVTLLIKPNVEVSKEKREKKWKMFSRLKF